MTPDERPVFLVGFMGSGKTTVGRLLAQELGWEFEDTDQLVERREARSIERIFEESGEAYFRTVERDCLEGLDGRRRIVVATGGGLFLRYPQRAWIKRRGRSIWLDVELGVVLRRVGTAPARPLWSTRDPLQFRCFFEKRRASYALCDGKVDASTGAPAEIAARICKELGGR